MKMWLATIAIALLGLGASAANAVTIEFAGTISNVDDPSGTLAGTGITAGTSTFSGTFSYDSAAASIASSTGAAAYLGVSFAVTIDGTIDMADAPPVITISNDLSSRDGFFIGSRGSIDVYELPLGGFTQFFINLFDSAGTLYNSTSLPTSLALDDFSTKRFAIRTGPSDIDVDDGYGIDGNIASLTVVGVPEPATLGLLGAGLFGLALMRRKRPA